MRALIAVVIFFCFAISSAYAQVGTAKTQSQLNAEIGANSCSVAGCLIPDQTQGQVTPYNMRQSLLDVIASMFGGGGSGPVSGPATSTAGDLAIWNNLTGTLLKDAGFPPRVVLTGNQTFYVNGNAGGTATCGMHGTSAPLTCSAGSDSNTCLSAASACLTTQHVISLIFSNYDAAGFSILINGAHCASASCGTNLAFNCAAGAIVGQGTINFIGDYDNPTAVELFAPNGNSAIVANDQCTVSVDSISIADQGSAAGGVTVVKLAQADLRSVTITGVWNNGAAILSAGGEGAVLNLIGVGSGGITNTIASTSTGQIFQSTNNGLINFNGQTVAIPAAITINGGLSVVYNVGGNVVGISSGTFTGSGVAGTTGARCVSFDAFWGNGDPNTVFPGNANCAMNRTFNSGAIVGPTTGGGNWALPSGADTIAGLASTQTLTNKTLTSPTINGGSISGGSLSGSSISGASMGGQTLFTGQLVPAYGTPVISSGNCGATTNGALASGSTNQSGQVQIGSATTTSCLVTFSTTLAVAPIACLLFPANATAAATGTTVARVSSISTVEFTITGSALANANYYYHCF